MDAGPSQPALELLNPAFQKEALDLEPGARAELAGGGGRQPMELFWHEGTSFLLPGII